MRSIVIVGAGPRGVGVLERIAASAEELIGSEPIEIHLVDPHPPGGGRVWRIDQSPLLRLNSTAEDVTLFLDDSVRCDGPIVRGPTIAEWAEVVGEPDLEPMSFPTRHQGNAYLTWVYERVVGALPDTMSMQVHATTALDITDEDGRQRVHLADGSDIDADAVMLTIGHLDADPAGEHAVAARSGLTYLPPTYGADVDLSAFAPGEDVIVRGFGLAFVDIQVLVTEGRGGRFEELGDGRLRYHPCGLEPVLHVGSRRGVPYRSKPTYRLQGPPPPVPRFFTHAAVDELLARPAPLLFRRDVWPLLAKEIAWGGYHELFHAHPERTALPWDDFDAEYAELSWATDGYDELVARAIPALADRFDFAFIDRPLDGLRFDSDDEVQSHVHHHIRADVDRRNDPSFSADLGAFNTFLSLFAILPRVLGAPTLPARSFTDDFDEWWWGFFNYYCSGPPPRRLEELLALSEAGLVRFIGADMWIEVGDGTFGAGSTSSPHVVEARALIDATLPKPSVHGSRDTLVRRLADRGELTELVLRDPDGTEFPTGMIRVDARDGRVVDFAGQRHRARFALGPHTSSKAPAFARPHTNAPVFRANDASARALLRELAAARSLAAPATGRG